MANHYYTTPEILAVPVNNPYYDRLRALDDQRRFLPPGIDRDMINLEIATLMERVKARKNMMDNPRNHNPHNHNYGK